MQVARGSKIGLVCLLLTLGAFRASPAIAQETVRYFNTGWDFDDVDVATLVGRLQRVGLNLPVNLAGQISGRLSVGIPWGALNSARAWRLGGRLTSPELTVNGFEVRQVSVRLEYRDGALGLEELQFRVPSPGQPGRDADGTLAGVARMELLPRGRFTASTQLTGFPLATLGQTFQSMQGIEGRMSGSLAAAVAVDQLRDIAAWDVSGPVTIDGFRFRDSPPATAAVQLVLDNAVLSAQQFRLAVGDTTLASSATLNLRGQQPWNVNATVAAGDVPALLDVVNGLLGGAPLDAAGLLTAGTMQGTVQLAGTLAPFSNSRVAGRAELTNLAIELPAELREKLPLRPLTIDRAAFNYSLAGDRLQLSSITASMAGGEVTGAAAFPLADGAAEANLQWSGVQLSRLLAEPITAGQSAGRLNLSIPSGAMATPERWQVTANLSLSEVSYSGFTFTDLQSGEVTLRQGRLAVPNLAARLEGEPVALSLDMALNDPRTFSSTFNLPRVQLAWLRRIPQLAESLPEITGVVAASGQLSGAWQPLQVKGRATVNGASVQVAGRTIDSIQFDVAVDERRITLSSIEAVLYGGRAAGTVAIAIDDAGDPGGSARLSWSNLEAARLLAGIELGPVALSGYSSGDLTAEIPAGSLNDREKWTGTARVQVQAVDVYAWQFRQLAPLELSLANGRLHTPELRAMVDGQPFTAAVTLGIDDAWILDVRGHGQQAWLERISAIPALASLQGRLAGRVDFHAHVHGTLNPVAISATGAATGRALRFDAHRVEALGADFSLTPDFLTLTSVDAAAYEGRLSGNALIPLSDAVAGSAAIAWDEIAVDRLLAGIAGTALNWQGGTSGSINLEVPPGSLGRPVDWNFTAKVAIPDLRANRVSIASLDATATQQAGNFSYQASGQMLGGRLELHGNRGVELADAAGPGALGSARLVIRDGGLGRLAQAAAEPGAVPMPVTGTFNLDVSSNAAADDWSWTGAMRLGPVSVADVPITTGMTARVAGNARLARLIAFSGQLAGGALGGSGDWQFAPRREGAFRVAVRGARMEQLAALATGADSSPFEGPIDVELLVRPGTTWRIAGTAASGRAEAAGVALRNTRLPIDVAWRPLSGQMDISINGAHLSLAGGRIAGRLTARRSTRWRLNGDFRFYRVDVTALTGSSYGRGRLTGTLTLDGRNMRSVNDLTGTMIATLEDTQASRLPVVDQLTNFVPGLSSSASTFSDGRFEAHLSRGVVRVEELSLASSQLQLYITGQVTLAGRLRLEAIASTGDRYNPLQAQSLLTRYALTAVAPVSLIAQANDFFRNRVVHLAIGGTFNRPAIRLLPFQSLREEAIRFFLRQATAAVLPGAAAASGSR